MDFFARKLARVVCLSALFLLPLIVGACAPRQAGSAPTASATRTAATGAGNCKVWGIVANPTLSGAQNQFNGVAAVSAQDVWAVGSGASPYKNQALIEHWNGTRWSVAASADVGPNEVVLNGIAALSATNIWAVGSVAAQPLVEHWDGSVWRLVQSASVPGTQSALRAVVALSAANVWAVGQLFGSQDRPAHALIEHWDGKSWNIAQNLDVGTASSDLEGIAGSSANDIWAVGSSASDKEFPSSLIEHWDGKSWKVVRSPSPGDLGTSLSAVAAASASDAWAVGEYNPRDAPGALLLVEHWNGAAWSVVSVTGPEGKQTWLSGLAVVAADDVWAVGGYEDFNTRLTQPFGEHWDGSQWNLDYRPIPSPANADAYVLNAVAAADAHTVWAVGSFVNPHNGSQPPIGDPTGKAAAQPLTMFRCP